MRIEYYMLFISVIFTHSLDRKFNGVYYLEIISNVCVRASINIKKIIEVLVLENYILRIFVGVIL